MMGEKRAYISPIFFNVISSAGSDKTYVFEKFNDSSIKAWMAKRKNKWYCLVTKNSSKLISKVYLKKLNGRYFNDSKKKSMLNIQFFSK